MKGNQSASRKETSWNKKQRIKGNRIHQERMRKQQQMNFTAAQMARAAAGEIGTPAMQANVRRRLEAEEALQAKEGKP